MQNRMHQASESATNSKQPTPTQDSQNRAAVHPRFLKGYSGCLLSGFLLVLVPFVFIETCMYFSGDSTERAREKFKKEVRYNVPAMFPVLMLTSKEGSSNYEAQLIYKQDLDNFLKNNSQYTYLVPEGQDDYLNKDLSKKHRPWQANFKVQRLSDNQQSLEVVYQDDDEHVNRGWYEATDKEILPKYYQAYFGPGLAFRAIGEGLVPAIILWIAIGLFGWACIYVIKRFKKIRSSLD